MLSARQRRATVQDRPGEPVSSNRSAAEPGPWAKGTFVQSNGTPALKQSAPLISTNASMAHGQAEACRLPSSPSSSPLLLLLNKMKKQREG
jgi:hypothetical protein